MIARRLRLAFVNTYAAEESLPRVVDIMAAELKWDKKEKQVCVIILNGWVVGYEANGMPSVGAEWHAKGFIFDYRISLSL